jgi:hypothetical protein
VGWEHEAELSHAPAESRAGFHQVRVDPGFGQVDGGPHAADAAANDQDAAGLFRALG